MKSASIDTVSPALEDLLEEFAGRVQAGESLDIETFAAAHPEHADLLRRVLPTMGVLADLARHSGETDASGLATHELPEKSLGDFRILREVGRGGMGVVYEAEQLSLGRRVALKVLPFAATMDSRHLQRFQNEARAAASLEHPHIVPVHGVGCERGVHYYAMKFIDGQSLAQVVDELKNAKEANRRDADNTEKNQNTAVSSLCSLRLCGSNDFFKSIAEMGIQAAEALEHAHSLGIVHRDIKPANLMIDGNGSLWVTDFGLARTAADAGLTMTGDVLGTLRYMSPEQAMAKHGLVDHRPDVYSLGVTLYELLTGMPAVKGKDREEILNAITLEDPRPPRRLDSGIPQDLETIVLKSLEKNPADRYATAKEFADELKRYLDDRPIHAKRPSFTLRARKWFRRHPAVLRSAAAILLITVVGLSVSSYLILQEMGKKESALDLAEKRQEAAEKSQQRTRAVLDDLSSELVEDWLTRQDELTDRQREFLTRALNNYEQFTKEAGETPEQRALLAQAHLKVGNIRQHLGQRDAAEEAFRRASEILTTLVSEFPTDASSRMHLAGTHNNLGRIIHGPAAVAEFRAAIAIAQRLAEDYPESPSYRQILAVSRANLANILSGGRQWEEGEKEVRKACELQNSLTDAYPTQPAYRSEWASSRKILGVLLARRGKLDDAEAEFRACRDLSRQLVKQFPAKPVYRQELAEAQTNLAIALSNLARWPEAETEYKNAAEIWQELVRNFPSVPRYRRDLSLLYDNLCVDLIRLGKLTEALAACREAIAVDPDLANSHHNLGVILKRTGQLDEAIAEYRKALELKLDVAELHCSLGEALEERGEFADALAHFRRGHELGSKQPDWSYPSAARVEHAQLMTEVDSKLTKIKNGDLTPKDGRERLALAQMCQTYKSLYLTAFRFYKEAFAELPKLVDDLQNPHRYNAACAAALAGCGQGKDADQSDERELAQLRRQSIEWLRADLAAWRNLLDTEPDKVRSVVVQTLQNWQQDKDFAGVRGSAALGKLPEAERQEWQKLWTEVDELRQKAAKPAK
jgi:serine/threonine protein kinase